MSTPNSVTVFLYSGNKPRFGMIIDKNITLRDFTRAIQYSSTFGISKANMRLNILQDDGTWKRLYSWRSRTAYETSIYDKPVSTIGITDNTCLQVKWVLSKAGVFFLGVAAIGAIPVSAGASVAAYGTVSGAYMAGFVVGTVAGKVTLQRAMSVARVIALAPDMPEGVLEIREL